MYSVWRSSYKAMDEFGIGVGLYYRQLLLLSIVRRCVHRISHISPVLRAALVAIKRVAYAIFCV